MTKQEYLEIYEIVGAAQEVHKTLGRGMHEKVYQESLALEMEKRGIDFEREKHLQLTYKGTPLSITYIPDFYYKEIIVELKSVDVINSDHRAQLFNYMRITGKNRGILLNFGEKSLRAERYLYLPKEDNFILLTQVNYRKYIDDE